MKEYKPDQIRNVVLLGHGSSGKTSLSEAMLYDAGATSRLGKVEDKNTVSDYDEEEQSRGFSVNTSILPAEWRDTKLNILDAPGYTDFVGEVKAAIRAADGAVLVVCAASGVEVGAELHWSFLDEANLPRIVFINKLDRDNASFSRTIEELKTKFSRPIVPLALPIGAQASFKGIVDLVSMKAYTSVEGQESDIPADMQDEAAEARTQMMEYAAEADDDLMMKYLEGEELTNDELREALAVGSRRGDFVLVMAGSATQNLGPRRLLDAVVDYLPSPTDRVVEAQNAATEEPVEIKADAAGPLVAQVFKTLADPFVGRLTYFRVFSGTFSSDSRVTNVNKGEEERVGQLFHIRGHEQTPVDSVKAGDIGAVAKLAVSITGDTLGDRGTPIQMPPVEYPEPLYSVAVSPKTKADLDKLGSSLSRLVEEDPTLRVERNTETNETILSGMGESHIQIATRRLAQKFGVEVQTDLPIIAYRETITKTAQAQGRHKKQTGGRGRFGDVWCRFEPLERGAGFGLPADLWRCGAQAISPPSKRVSVRPWRPVCWQGSPRSISVLRCMTGRTTPWIRPSWRSSWPPTSPSAPRSLRPVPCCWSRSTRSR